MRNPSIHLLKSDVVSILLQFLEKKQAETIADALLRYGYQKRVVGRQKVTVTSKAVKQKIEKSIETDNHSVEVFNRLLYAVRESKNHRFIKTIRANDREYSVLKEVAQIAEDFVSLFEIKPKEEGFKTFISIGLDLIGKKYALSKFKYYKANIFELYENALTIHADNDAEATKKFYKIWRNTMLTYCNMDIELNQPEKYVNMVYGRQEADDAGATYENWIKAQFEQLAWLNAIPELTQLYGKHAKERYSKYSIKKVEKQDVDDTLPTKYSSPEEQAYWEAIRQKRATK